MRFFVTSTVIQYNRFHFVRYLLLGVIDLSIPILFSKILSNPEQKKCAISDRTCGAKNQTISTL